MIKLSEELGDAPAEAGTTQDAHVRLIADGAVIRPVIYAAGAYCFVVPRAVESVFIVSRFAVQADAPLDYRNGGRGVGVSVAEISLRSDAGEETIAADDPRLTSGWFDARREGAKIWRSTDGAAQVPWDKVQGPALVTVRCSHLLQNPVGYVVRDGDCPTPDAYKLMARLSGGATPSGLPAGIPLKVAATEIAATARIQWCVGMYSSGSTWVFNAIRSVGETLLPNEPFRGGYAESVDQFPPGWLEGDRVMIKSHHADDAATALLIRHANPIWISIRDPRDCVASAWTYIFKDFDVALDAVTRSALHCERLLSQVDCILLRYEDGFIDDPSTLDRFASAFSRSLSPDAREALFRQTRRNAIEAIIRNLDPTETIPDGYADNRVHMKTQWHTHHVNRTGEVGRWRNTLNSKQADEVQRRLRSWMQKFGYLH